MIGCGTEWRATHRRYVTGLHFPQAVRERSRIPFLPFAVFRMAYTVKEIFYTLQGEGAQVGRPAVFCRFAGCNLWSGLERDRAAAVCKFCDTDFVGTNGERGGKYADVQSL